MLKLMSLLLIINQILGNEILECNLKYSNYFKVRETTCPNRWYSAHDFLQGTQLSYG